MPISPIDDSLVIYKIFWHLKKCVRVLNLNYVITYVQVFIYVDNWDSIFSVCYGDGITEAEPDLRLKGRVWSFLL